MSVKQPDGGILLVKPIANIFFKRSHSVPKGSVSVSPCSSLRGYPLIHAATSTHGSFKGCNPTAKCCVSGFAGRGFRPDGCGNLVVHAAAGADGLLKVLDVGGHLLVGGVLGIHSCAEGAELFLHALVGGLACLLLLPNVLFVGKHLRQPFVELWACQLNSVFCCHVFMFFYFLLTFRIAPFVSVTVCPSDVTSVM